jgi:hypothetical protein
LTGRPVYRMDEAYCCLGCAEAGPCTCDYEVDLAADGVSNLGLLAPVEPVGAGEAVEPAPGEVAQPAGR